MKKHSDDMPDWQEQRNKIIGLGESSLRKSYYPELREMVAELEKKNDELHAAYEQLASSEEELRENYDTLSRQEQELRESEEKYRNLVENTFDGVMIHQDKVIVFANRTAAKLIGCADPGSLLGRSILQVTHPDFRQIVTERSSHALTSIQLPRHEIFLHEDGTAFDVDIVASPATWNGAPAVQISFRDITAQKTAETALHESEERYRTLVETTDTGFVIGDTNGRVVDANQKYVQISGHTEPAEIIGRSVLEWTAEYEREKNALALEQCIREGVLRNFEIDYINSLGAITPVEINATVVQYGSAVRILTLCRDISERRKTEQALRESEIFYRTVFDTTGSGSVILGKDTTIIRANEGFARLSGFSVGELEGKHRWTEFVVPEDLERMKKYHDDRRESQKPAPQEYEFRFIDRFGTKKHCLNYVAMFPGTTQSIASLVDISERVAVERELEKKNRELQDNYAELSNREESLRKVSTELQLILKSMINAFIIWESVFDEQGNYVSFRFGYFNDSYAHIAGVNLEDVQGRDVFEVWPTTEKSWLDVFREVALTGVPRTFEMYHDPTKGFYHCNAYRPQETPDRICVIFEDITERKRADEELRSAKNHLEAVYRGSPDLIFVHAADGHIIDVNENVLTAFGLTREEAIVVNPTVTSGTGYTLEMASAYLKSALETGQAEFDWECRRKNGGEFPVNIRLRRIEAVNERGEMEPRILAIARDITERRMAEKALEQARKKLGLLNTVIFQDIQSTIFALSAYLQLANNTIMDEKSRTYAEKEAFLIHKIVSSLNFARNYQDMGINPSRWQGVNQVFLYAISHLDSLKVARNIQVGGLEIYADPLLEKVFFNMVENVFLHGQHVSAIAMEYEVTGEGLILSLEDNGIGIPSDEKLKIFERGYGKNTGLGLFLAREILSITDITIRETGEPGKGARFEMVVPKGAYRFVEEK
ncbi:PAS domain S-box protein [Methanoregula sp.]|uniref:PAS domain S-box protein n=1 Tax=Methanoregula sp. TaxID=2052170 RepID=UPI00236D3288|nr:PAS domain S-box protein [Methanoregula sp.]MDD1685882.1 PAS domain S-box protein [Methanoregula sp.]